VRRFSGIGLQVDCLECDGADGIGDDHDGYDDRDVNLFGLVFVEAVAIVPRTRP